VVVVVVVVWRMGMVMRISTRMMLAPEAPGN
jgi:hypothetical protein